MTEHARVGHRSPAAPALRPKGKIWIDLDNSPHVPFFAPIIGELERRGYGVVLTARDCAQTRELVNLFRLDCKVIGRHFGKNTFHKMAGLCFRASQLAPTIVRERPNLAISHCSRSQLIVSASLRIPTLFIGDYEFSTTSAVIHPQWFMCPDVIPDAAVQSGSYRLLKYPGIKEDVYVPRFVPDAGIRHQLGLGAQDLVITVRPPATEAHYHNHESTELFEAAIEVMRKEPGAKVVALPRNDRQAVWLRARWPDLFSNGTIRIPPSVVDGLNLIWYSDLVVSAGGTMNREAAALAVPVYSIFRGTIGAVDHYLSQTGRLVLLESVLDVQTKMPLVRRNRPSAPAAGNSATLNSIVEHVVALSDFVRGAAPRRVA